MTPEPARRTRVTLRCLRDRAQRLLPDADDRLRVALERNARIIDAASDSIDAALPEAFDRRGRGGGRPVRASRGPAVGRARLVNCLEGSKKTACLCSFWASRRAAGTRTPDPLLTMDCKEGPPGS